MADTEQIPEQKKPWIATCESVRWFTYCGLGEVLDNGEWWTLKGLMEIEARLAGMESEEWAPQGIGDWFGVRASQELVKHTGLSRGKQGVHLSSLETKWNLIETRLEEKRRRTEVRFVDATLQRLALHCIPRLKPYEGGLRGVKVKDLPDFVYYWIRPDLEGWDSGWTMKKFARFLNIGEDTQPSLVQIRKILLEPIHTT